MQSKNLVQSVTVKAKPHDVFEALMDSRRHAKLIGASAKIGRKPGDAFSVWGGEIVGRTLELVKDKRIVQTWRSGDWPKGHYSGFSWISAEMVCSVLKRKCGLSCIRKASSRASTSWRCNSACSSSCSR